MAEALAQLQTARADVEASLDQLSGATQSALDIPAKIRRNPVKTAALVGGAGFLLAGGPRRLVRFAANAVRPERPDPYAGLLPPEIEKVLKDVGLADDPEVRRALDQDFAEYLKSKGRYEPQPTRGRLVLAHLRSAGGSARHGRSTDPRAAAHGGRSRTDTASRRGGETADAAALGAVDREVVQVRVLSPAPRVDSTA